MAEINITYEQYVKSKIKDIKQLPILYYPERAELAAQRLSKDYDLGIELANDGLATGYFFHKQGLPIKTVKVSRKGSGASWRPLDKIVKEDIKGKKLIVFENDIVTGRTLRKAVQELQMYSPEFIDLLLVHDYTRFSVKTFKKWRHHNNVIRAIEDTIPKEITAVIDVPDGILLEYFDEESGIIRVIEKKENDFLSLNYKRNLPPGFRKVMTLANDFKIER